MAEERIENGKDDPDYEEFYQKKSVDPPTAQAEDSKYSTVSRISEIIEKQFVLELDLKEREINKIEHRIHQTKLSLDRFRAYAVAGYFGSGGKIIPCAKAKTTQSKEKTVVQDAECTAAEVVCLEELQKQDMKSLEQKNSEFPKSNSNTICNTVEQPVDDTRSRFYTLKRVIVGNVSKYLVADMRKENDKSTHKWMVYVRTESQDDNEIADYIKCVQFFLHPSYIPNDIVTVSKPPFQVTRRGWGEFPVRVQLHFKDSRNKRFDVIHNLKLDKTYTGLQTLGAETIVNLELHRHATLKQSAIINPTTNVDRNVPEEDLNLLSSTIPVPEENKEMNDESVNKKTKLTLPIIADLRSKLPAIECASVASSCVSSANVSRCNSPITETPTNSIITDPEIESIMCQFVNKAVLICERGDQNFEHFTCPTLQTYCSWHFTKRRASEWQRALFLKDLLLEHLYTNGKNIKCPSTKEIVYWLRLTGFTPPEKNLVVIYKDEMLLFCNMCGKVLPAPTKNPSAEALCDSCRSDENHNMIDSSLSSYTTVISNIEIKERTLQDIEKLNFQRDRDVFEMEVDVDDTETNQHDYNEEECDDNNASSLSHRLHSAENTVMATDLENWVTDVVQHLGVSIQPVLLSDTKTYALQAMLVQAMKSFMFHLLRRSSIEAKQGNKFSLEPAMVTFNNVYSALNNVQLFDFLTEAHLGKS